MQVSIIVPVYNTVRYLEKCVYSILAQPEVGEVILIDDRSTDGSYELCKKLNETFDSVKLYQNDGVKGSGAARNIGLKYATCDFVSFVDSDDYLLPYRFSKDINFISNNPKIDVLASTMIVHNPQNLVAEQTHNQVIGPKFECSPITMADFIESMHFSIPGMLMRKEVLGNTGVFDESLKQAQDVEFIVRVILRSRTVSSPDLTPKYVYRRHNSNTTNNKKEAAYFRRKAYVKLIKMASKENLSFSVMKNFIMNYVEYDYQLTKIGDDFISKKFTKIIRLPLYTYRLLKEVNCGLK